jgi:RNA polymerase primary sigma factor
LRRDLGQEPSPDRIADALGLSAAQRVMVDRAFRAKKVRLDTDRSGEDGDSGWCTEDARDTREPVETTVEAAEAREEIRHRLSRLDDRERSVISLRFGLDGRNPMTLKEIGRKLGVTREWVRKIESRAVRKLDDRYDPAMAAMPRVRGAAAAMKTA